MFGDWSYLPTRENEQIMNYNNWKNNIIDKNVVVIEIGAGKVKEYSWKFH